MTILSDRAPFDMGPSPRQKASRTRLRPSCLAVLALVGLFGGGCGKPDERVGPLSARIVAQLKADPVVADAQYRYVVPQGVDDSGPYLVFDVQVASERTGPDELKPPARRAVEEAWRTPARVDKVKVVFTARTSDGTGAASTGTDPARQPLFQVDVNLLFTSANAPQASAEPTFSVDPGAARRYLDQWRFAQSLQRELYGKYGPHKS